MIKRTLMIGLCLVWATSACETENPNNGSTTETDLELSYVSGHLGSYWDCPEEANGASPAATPSMAEFAADCDGEGCGGMLNCEAAEVTIQVKNLGPDVVQNLDVLHVLLLDDSQAEPADLEVLSWSVTPADALDDGLAPDEVVTLHVQFRGFHSVDFSGPQPAFPVNIEVEDDQGGTVDLTTPPLDILPMMVT